MNAQLKKGILELCILYILNRGDTYGYPLMKEMHTHFPDVDESTIYSILRRIKSEGYAETYMDYNSGGPARKYYHLSENGIIKLNQTEQEWETINKLVNSIKGGN